MLGFSGALYPVNPNSAAILGKTAYPSLTAIPGQVDAAVIAIPAAGVPAIVEEAGKTKRSRWLSSSLLVSARPGRPGKALEDQVLATARKYGIRVMGPNCLGFMLPKAGNQHHI